MRRETKLFFMLWGAMLGLMAGGLIMQYVQIHQLGDELAALERKTQGAIYLANEVWRPSYDQSDEQLKTMLRRRADALNRELNQLIVDETDG